MAGASTCFRSGPSKSGARCLSCTLLIIFASIFEPSLALLIILLSLFGWMGLSDYVRGSSTAIARSTTSRRRALGLSNVQIMWRHILPNSVTPVITFLPFRMSASILALTSLDFLGLGVPPTTPSLGELLAQGKGNLDAWWISLSTFTVLVVTLLLLTFMGDALRDAFDTRLGLAALRGRVAPKVPAGAPAGVTP
ncbi:ABC transporter permease subunit [Cupriavidus basilensis]